MMLGQCIIIPGGGGGPAAPVDSVFGRTGAVVAVSGDYTKSQVGLGNVDNLQQVPLSQKGVANGVATLDAGGKIPVAQLPSSVMEYKGVWDASTNTPTLADGVGTNGDVYLVNVAGTQDLGSGSITFAVGDWVIYNGSIWQKSLNSNAVSSVAGKTGAVTLDSDDITLTTDDTEILYDNSNAIASMTGYIFDGTDLICLNDKNIAFGTGKNFFQKYNVTNQAIEWYEGANRRMWILANTVDKRLYMARDNDLTDATGQTLGFRVMQSNETSPYFALSGDKWGTVTLLNSVGRIAIDSNSDVRINPASGSKFIINDSDVDVDIEVHDSAGNNSLAYDQGTNVWTYNLEREPATSTIKIIPRKDDVDNHDVLAVEDTRSGFTNEAIVFRVGSNFGQIVIKENNSTKINLNAEDGITISNDLNIILGTGNGTQIATATTQKFAFWGATPIVQLAKASYNNWAALSDVVDALVAVGLFDTA